MLFFLLMNVKMPTIVGILTLMSKGWLGGVMMLGKLPSAGASYLFGLE